MWLRTLRLRNIKGFTDSGEIEFSKGINLLVGPNNSGKTTILKSIQLLQPFVESQDHSILARSDGVNPNNGNAEFELADIVFKQLKINRPCNWHDRPIRVSYSQIGVATWRVEAENATNTGHRGSFALKPNQTISFVRTTQNVNL